MGRCYKPSPASASFGGKASGSGLTLISLPAVIDPTQGQFQGICAPATAHGHLGHVVRILLALVLFLLVEQATSREWVSWLT